MKYLPFMLILAVAGCGRAHSHDTQPAKPLSADGRRMVRILDGAPAPTLDSAVMTKTIFANDGGVYFQDQCQGLWYARGATATRVKDAQGQELLLEFTGLRLSPSTGLYLYARKREGLWYIHQGVATLVKEVTSTHDLDSTASTGAPVMLTIDDPDQ